MSGELKFEVGSVERDFPEKFIVAGEGEDKLVYHAASKSRVRRHENIAEEEGYSREQVLGGGKADYSEENSELRLYGKSDDFGCVPEDIIEEFIPELKEVYEDLDIEVKEIEIIPNLYALMPEDERKRKWGKYLKKLE